VRGNRESLICMATPILTFPRKGKVQGFYDTLLCREGAPTELPSQERILPAKGLARSIRGQGALLRVSLGHISNARSVAPHCTQIPRDHAAQAMLSLIARAAATMFFNAASVSGQARVLRPQSGFTQSRSGGMTEQAFSSSRVISD
jgi:hypothetical protein